MATYPPGYPLPQRDPYAYSVDMGVYRTAMESGAPRQRRRYATQPHYFNLEFIVPVADIDTWQQWINQNAYEFFYLPLVNHITIGSTMCGNFCLARFTSDLAISVLTKDFLRVTVAAELQPGQNNTNPTRTDWIIGGTPAAPSLDWVIGGTPSSPSPDWTVPI